jgi:hypothetical protein
VGRSIADPVRLRAPTLPMQCEAWVSAGAIESKGSWLSSREVSLNGFLGMEGLGAT